MRRPTWRGRNDVAAAATRPRSPSGAAGASGRGRKLLIPRPQTCRRAWTAREPRDGGRRWRRGIEVGAERRRGDRHASPFADRSRRCLRKGSKALNPPSSNLPSSVRGAGAGDVAAAGVNVRGRHVFCYFCSPPYKVATRCLDRASRPCLAGPDWPGLHNAEWLGPKFSSLWGLLVGAYVHPREAMRASRAKHTRNPVEST